LEGTLHGGRAAPELVLIPLSKVGDALRAEIELSRSVRTWLRVLPEQELGAALDAQREEAGEWRVPVRVSGDDPGFAFTIRRRDEAESVCIAAARSAFARQLVPGSVHGFKELGDALIAFDQRLATVATRGDVEAMLGTRAALQAPQGWTSRLPEDSRGAAPRQTSEHDLSVERMCSEPLSEEAISAWISHGRLSKLVEGRAARDPGFRDELTRMIDMLLAHHEQVSLVARRWAGLCEYPVPPQLAAAAAVVGSEASSVPSTDTDLGRLSPLPARARLLCTAHQATLRVYADPGTLRSVRFGSGETTSPDASGAWSVEIPIENEPVELQVVGASGEEFRATLVLVDVPAEEAT